VSPVDVAIVAAFVVYCTLSGWRARTLASRNLDEYFLAGRTLPGWVAGISMAATQFAADTPLLVTGMIATDGVFALWRLWIYALAFLLMGFLLAPAWRRARVLTDAELAELRYGGPLGNLLRAAKAVYFGLVFNCAVLAMVLFAATRIAEPFLHWSAWLPPGVFAPVVTLVEQLDLSLTSGADPHAIQSAENLLSLLALLAVTLLYSTTGGLRAVVATDVVQFALAMLGTAVYAAVVIGAVGGLAALPGALAERYGDAFAAETLAFTPSRARDAGLAVLGVIAFQWIAQMNADGTGYLAQRAMACRSDADARGAALVFVAAQVLARSLLWIPLGLGLLLLYPLDPGLGGSAAIAAREQTYVTGIADLMPAGLRGLLLTGMLAALASTLDSHLNWGASYFTNDLYKRLYCQTLRRREPSERVLVRVARVANTLILLLSIAVLARLESIQGAWKTTLLLGAGMGVPLLLRWFWWRVTAAGELLAIVAATLLAPVLLRGVEPEAMRILVMAAASTAVVVGVALAGDRQPGPAVIEFYRRTRPPGAWGRVAAALGEDARAPMRRLRSGLTATAASAAATFCVLVAAGTWLVGGTPPAWLPWRPAWLALVSATGLAAAWWARRSIAGLDPPR
jgi:Na+/proline symporter